MLILKALANGPRHGYDIMEWLYQTSDDQLEVEEGALYPALHRLLERDFVESEWGLSESNRKARYYRLSPKGREQLLRSQREWSRHKTMVERILAAET